VLALCAAGFFFGSNWLYVVGLLGSANIVIVIFVVLVLFALWRRYSHRRREAVVQA